MDERTYKSLLSILDWLEVGGYDEPLEDIERVANWAEKVKDEYPSTRES